MRKTYEATNSRNFLQLPETSSFSGSKELGYAFKWIENVSLSLTSLSNTVFKDIESIQGSTSQQAILSQLTKHNNTVKNIYIYIISVATTVYINSKIKL
jgi:hypothetical protein